MTVRESLGRVLRSFESGESPDLWVDARELIADERKRLEATLEATPEVRIYGFTTLLGHLDSVSAPDVGQTELLSAHLIGPTTDAPAEFLRLVTLCKTEQLHHGGSGIHPKTYDRVLAASTRDGISATGSWLASYGAGDVVPAAWWIRSTFDPAGGDLQQGDVISLLNGTFYSTALATAASVAAVDVITAFLARSTFLCRFPAVSKRRARERLSPAILGAFPDSSFLADGADGQLPISLRDAAVYVVPAATVIDALGATLDRRLASPSANPLFTSATDGTIGAESQSSFLDTDLTFALTNLIQYLHLSIGAIQRMIVHLCRRELVGNARPDPRYVQPPKVAQALAERGHLIAGQLPSRFSGSESDGVEDLRDLSLLTAATAYELGAIARDVLAILDEVLRESGHAETGPQDLLRAEFTRLFVGGAQLDSHGLFAQLKPLAAPFLR